MKLLTTKEAQSQKKLENDALIESNMRLKQVEARLSSKLHSMKDNYDQDKVEKWTEYEDFVEDINNKKSVLLKELKDIQKYIEEKKEVYYGLVEKQDILEEKMHNLIEKEKKLELREAFVMDLERKWREKQP